MEDVCERSTEALPAVIGAAAGSAMTREGSEIFVPENVDITCCLEESTKLCYVMHVLCKAGMGVCEIALLVLSGISVTEIKDNIRVRHGDSGLHVPSRTEHRWD
jgi:hypothetical protein